MAKTVWKVVSFDGDKRFSAVAPLSLGGICYANPGQPTIAPKDTKLLAFATKKAALSFGGQEVWKAEAKDVTPQSRLFAWRFGSAQRFFNFWRSESEETMWMTAPSGTVSCSELTLIEKVG